MKNIASICPLLFLAACVSTPMEPIASNDKDGKICERTYPTGSSIFKVQCTTPEQREQQQQGVSEVRDSIRRAHGTSTTSPGG